MTARDYQRAQAAAVAAIAEPVAMLKAVAALLKCPVADVPARAEALQREVDRLEGELRQAHG